MTDRSLVKRPPRSCCDPLAPVGRDALHRSRVVRAGRALAPAPAGRRRALRARPGGLRVLGPGGAVPVAQLTLGLRVRVPAWGDVGAHEKDPTPSAAYVHALIRA